MDIIREIAAYIGIALSWIWTAAIELAKAFGVFGWIVFAVAIFFLGRGIYNFFKRF